MISFEEMPENNEDLAKIIIDFLSLSDNSPDSCPASISEILDYLADEAVGGDRLTPSDLNFIRTAQVENTRYWIWSFNEPDGGAACYVTVAAGPDSKECIGFDENYYNLTPEQFILGDYHNVF